MGRGSLSNSNDVVSLSMDSYGSKHGRWWRLDGGQDRVLLNVMRSKIVDKRDDDLPEKLRAFMSVACALRETIELPRRENHLRHLDRPLGLFLRDRADGASGTTAAVGKSPRSLRSERAREASLRLARQKSR